MANLTRTQNSTSDVKKFQPNQFTPYKTIEISPLPRFERVPITEYIRSFPGIDLEEICFLMHIDRGMLNKVFVDPLINFREGGKHVGGYYSKELNIIGINPIILLQGEAALAHVLYHESLHAGFVLNEENERITGIMDEGLVETLTVKRMIEAYGCDPIKSGYQEIVDELFQYFGNFSDTEILNDISDNHVTTLDNILEKIVLWPLVRTGNINNLTRDRIKSELFSKWMFIRRYFNRLLNDVDGRNVNPFEDAIMDVSEYKLDNLMNRAVELMIETFGIYDIFSEIADEINCEITKAAVIEGLKNSDKLRYIFKYLVESEESRSIEDSLNRIPFSKSFYEKLHEFVAAATIQRYSQFYPVES